MLIDWDRLIAERDVWVAHNFPDTEGKRAPLDSILGCVEEVGELVHAHLKQVQKIRGTDEEHDAAARDSIGDLTVYLLGVLSCWNLRPAGEVQDPPDNLDAVLLGLASAVGNLAGDYLVKDPQWNHATISDIIYHCELYCELRRWDYADIVNTTWSAVSKRDWITYPDTGLPPVS